LKKRNETTVARRVYFGFDYEDVKTFRANVVRNHDVVKRELEEAAGFFDASIWEDAELHGEAAVKRLINSALENTSVTCILIGTGTWQRRWVRYEILKSNDRGNKMFGVHINSVPDKNQQTFLHGLNPFSYLGFVINADGRQLTYHEHDGTAWKVYQDLPVKATSFDNQYRGKGYRLSDWVPCYDWISGDGYKNFPTWVDDAK
jgi:hypothetical protein